MTNMHLTNTDPTAIPSFAMSNDPMFAREAMVAGAADISFGSISADAELIRLGMESQRLLAEDRKLMASLSEDDDIEGDLEVALHDIWDRRLALAMTMSETRARTPAGLAAKAINIIDVDPAELIEISGFIVSVADDAVKLCGLPGADVVRQSTSIAKLAGQLRGVTGRFQKLRDKYDRDAPKIPAVPDADMQAAYHAAPDHEAGRAARDAVHAIWHSAMNLWKVENDEYWRRTGLKYAFRVKCRRFRRLGRRVTRLAAFSPQTWADLITKSQVSTILERHDVHTSFDLEDYEWIDLFNETVVRDVVRLGQGGDSRPAQPIAAPAHGVENAPAYESMAA